MARPLQFFKRIPSARIATLVTETVPDMRKTDNPYVGRIKKISRINVIIGPNYESVINKRLNKENSKNAGNFHSLSRQWGKRIEGTCLVKHKGKYYLETMILQSLNHEYMLDDKPIKTKTLEELHKFLNTKKESNRANLSPENVVVWRDYALQNIKEVKMDGKTIKF